MIENGCVSIERADSPDAVYCSATAYAGSDSAQVTVQGDHTGIVEERKNGEVVFKKEPAISTNAEGQSAVGGEEINLKAIYDFALKAPFEDIAFILQARDINMAWQMNMALNLAEPSMSKSRPAF